MANWRTEFPDLQVPAWTQALVAVGALIDGSWHNDATASFATPDGKVLWVHPADPSLREFPCGMFVVLSGDGNGAEPTVLADSDQGSSAVAALAGSTVIAGWIRAVSVAVMDDALREDALAALNCALELTPSK